MTACRPTRGPLWPLAIGHLVAMLLVLLSFVLLIAIVEWQRTIQIGASLLVTGFGLYRLANRRHPKVLARISPAQLGLWSFAVALAHGAALMLVLMLVLVPIYLGLCREAELDRGHAAADTLINANLGMAVLVAIVHAAAMIAAGGCCAWLAYRHLGLKFISRSWFNLDAVWAISLIVVGVIALVLSVVGGNCSCTYPEVPCQIYRHARASTSCAVAKKDVDGRVKPGHD